MKIQFITPLFLLLSTAAFSQNDIVIEKEKSPIHPQEQNDTDEEVFTIVEEMPQYPGGQIELAKFVAQNVEYPDEARENDIQGKVYVQFIINKNGEAVKARIVRTAHPLLDQAALDVINKLQKFTPGKQRGKLVNVYYTMPINFMLSDGDDDASKTKENNKKKKKKRRN